VSSFSDFTSLTILLLFLSLPFPLLPFPLLLLPSLPFPFLPFPFRSVPLRLALPPSQEPAEEALAPNETTKINIFILRPASTLPSTRLTAAPTALPHHLRRQSPHTTPQSSPPDSSHSTLRECPTCPHRTPEPAAPVPPSRSAAVERDANRARNQGGDTGATDAALVSDVARLDGGDAQRGEEVWPRCRAAGLECALGDKEEDCAELSIPSSPATLHRKRFGPIFHRLRWYCYKASAAPAPHNSTYLPGYSLPDYSASPQSLTSAKRQQQQWNGHPA